MGGCKGGRGGAPPPGSLVAVPSECLGRQLFSVDPVPATSLPPQPLSASDGGKPDSKRRKGRWQATPSAAQCTAWLRSARAQEGGGFGLICTAQPRVLARPSMRPVRTKMHPQLKPNIPQPSRRFPTPTQNQEARPIGQNPAEKESTGPTHPPRPSHPPSLSSCPV
jgi:hypothetical protein